MRAGWEIVKLDEVISFERGLTYAKGDEVAYSSVGVLRSNNVDLTTQSLNLDEIKYLREDFEVPPKKKVRKSSLLMCMSNGSKDHLGKVALIDRELDYAFGGFMGLLTPDEGKVFPKYLYYALASKSFKDYIHSLADGANINNLKYKDLAAFDILLPSLAEQQRIVDILDQEFAKIDVLEANAEKSLQAAKDLFQATLKKELEPKDGWENKTFGEIGAFQRGGGFIKSDFVEDGFPCIHYGQIHMKFGTATYSHYTSIPKELAEKSKIASPGDIIIAITSEDVAGSCKSTAWMGDYDVAIGAHAAIFKHCLNPLFVSYFIQSCYFQREKEAYTHGFKVVEIKPSDIAKIPIHFPSLPEQLRIVEVLEEVRKRVDALQENAQRTIPLCDDLKQALLRKAFNGEL